MYTHQIRPSNILMKNNMLVKHYAGSISYGTNLPTSDVDFRGVFCADPINIRTPFFTVRECEDVNEEDTKLYELSHFMKLCLDCNPNIVETLWVDDADITHRTPAYDLLREHRHSLLSSKIAFTTSGYAISQLKRIKGHNKWINNPQSVEPPKQIDFISLVQNFTEDKIFSIDLRDYHKGYRLIPYGYNIYGLIAMPGCQTYSNDYTLNTTIDEEENETLSINRKNPLFVIKFNKDEYNLAKDKHKNYWIWKENRNEARSELEEKYGFDTKHAMHLVRLLRMGVEALRDEGIVVKRPDAKELLDIRNGKWTYNEIVEYAEEMDNEVRNVWYKKTNLQKKPDIKFAANLLMNVQDIIWNTN